jgi:LmbE family N-acetylglucosaminyl deacetylase
MKRSIKTHLIIGIPLLLLTSLSHAQVGEIHNAADLQLALQKLDVLGSVLYVGAHPDDENTAFLAYFSKGRKVRAAYLSMTRGDGGQNLLGTEQGVEMGIIRTQELLAARRIDGAEQFFTRAIDFGYSKSAEETFAFWGKDQILADVVWVIRKFRPDVIVTRFSPEGFSGHGHHAASAILAREAFRAAADPARFPEQLKYVQPWQARRIFWNAWRPGQQEVQGLAKINTGEYNPLLGKAYSSLAAESRSMHKTQGFGSSSQAGARFEYFELLDGEPASTDIFEGIDTSWNRVPGAANIGTMIGEILDAYNPVKPALSIPKLLAVSREMDKIDDLYWVPAKRAELLDIIRSCAGLEMEATADDYSAASGDAIRIKTTLVSQSGYPFTVDKITFPAADSVLHLALKSNDALAVEKTIRLPGSYPVSQPFWLSETPDEGRFKIADPQLIGPAENKPSIEVKVVLKSEGTALTFSIPVTFQWTDRVKGELVRPFEVRPPVTMNVENPVYVFRDARPADVNILIKSHSPNVSGQITLTKPDGWKVTPASIPFALNSKYEERKVTFHVTPPIHPDETVLAIRANVDGRIWNQGLVEISYPHIKNQVYFSPAQIKTIRLDIKTVERKIAYIMGAGDEIPDVLRNLGYQVVLLDDEMLETADLSQFDTIITGIRAYNTRTRLAYDQPRLLRFVENGGTLVVQYNVAANNLIKNIGPYPLTIGRDRISDERATMSFIDPQHQLLNFPNKVTEDDFAGWVQERGLYFASSWDNQYVPILSGHDANESEQKGGLLFAHYGKGVFVYTAQSWFRQLPAGVPGAYRMFVNLISAGNGNGRIKGAE